MRSVCAILVTLFRFARTSSRPGYGHVWANGVHGNTQAFAALDANGAITAWGKDDHGGNGAPAGSGYVSIASSCCAFAALDANGAIAAWGNIEYGGSSTPAGSGYISIASTAEAFAAKLAAAPLCALG